MENFNDYDSESSENTVVLETSDEREEEYRYNFEEEGNYDTGNTEFRRYLSYLDRRFNIVHDILCCIFEQAYNDDYERHLYNFYIDTYEIKKDILNDKPVPFYMTLSLHVLNAGNPIDITGLDLLIFHQTQHKSIFFRNIFLHLRCLFPRSLTVDEMQLTVYYNNKTNKLESSGTFQYIRFEREQKNKIVKRIKKQLSNLIHESYITPVFFLGDPKDLKDIIRIKKPTKRFLKTSENIRHIEPDHLIQLEEYTQNLEEHVDIDGFWALCKHEDIFYVKSPLLVDLERKESSFSSISKSCYIINQGVPTRVRSLLNFKLGTFQADPSFPIHVFLISKYTAKILTPQRIRRISEKLENCVRTAIQDLKRSDAYSKYLLSVENNDDIHFNIRNRNIEEAGFGFQRRRIKQSIGDSLVVEFFNHLHKQDEYTRIVQLYHLESFGNKRWSSSSNVTRLYSKLEEIIDTEQIKFVKVDFAFSVAFENMELLNHKKGLYIESNFYDEHFVVRNTLFCSRRMPNINSRLWSIQRSKLVLDPFSLDKINIYSCLVPELFDRGLRTSKACQITSKALFDAMIKAQTKKEYIDDKKVVKQIRDSLVRLQRRELMDHSFRIEISSSLYTASVAMQRAFYTTFISKKFIYDTEAIYDYLEKLCRIVLNFFDDPISSRDDFLKIMIYEVLLVEIYIKGTTNSHFLCNREVDDYLKTFLHPSAIPLHDIRKTADDLLLLIEKQSLKNILEETVKYSIQIPKLKKIEVFQFIGVLFEDDLYNWETMIIESFNNFRREIPTKKISVESEPITPTNFINTLLSLEKFDFFPIRSDLYKSLVYLKNFKPDITLRLRHRLIVAANNDQFLCPIDRRPRCRLYQKYSFSTEVDSLRPTPISHQLDDQELRNYIETKSYATTSKIMWSEFDIHRLNAAIRFYRGRSVADYCQAISYDLRFGFWASVPLSKIRDKIKALQKKQRQLDGQSETLHHLGDEYSLYEFENISFSTLIQIYTHRYGIEMTKQAKEGFKKKFITYVDPSSSLITTLHTHESQQTFIQFYKDSLIQPSLLGVLKKDIHRIAYEMLTLIKNPRTKQSFSNLTSRAIPDGPRQDPRQLPASESSNVEELNYDNYSEVNENVEDVSFGHIDTCFDFTDINEYDYFHENKSEEFINEISLSSSQAVNNEIKSSEISQALKINDTNLLLQETSDSFHFETNNYKNKKKRLKLDYIEIKRRKMNKKREIMGPISMSHLNAFFETKITLYTNLSQNETNGDAVIVLKTNFETIIMKLYFTDDSNSTFLLFVNVFIRYFDSTENNTTSILFKHLFIRLSIDVCINNDLIVILERFLYTIYYKVKEKQTLLIISVEYYSLVLTQKKNNLNFIYFLSERKFQKTKNNHWYLPANYNSSDHVIHEREKEREEKKTQEYELKFIPKIQNETLQIQNHLYTDYDKIVNSKMLVTKDQNITDRGIVKLNLNNTFGREARKCSRLLVPLNFSKSYLGRAETKSSELRVVLKLLRKHLTSKNFASSIYSTTIPGRLNLRKFNHKRGRKFTKLSVNSQNHQKKMTINNVDNISNQLNSKQPSSISFERTNSNLLVYSQDDLLIDKTVNIIKRMFRKAPFTLNQVRQRFPGRSRPTRQNLYKILKDLISSEVIECLNYDSQKEPARFRLKRSPQSQ